MGSVFASSGLPGAVSAGAAIETPYTAGEGGTGGGGRAEREATLLKCTSVAACDAVFCSKRGHVHNILSAYWWTLTARVWRCSVCCRPPAGVDVPAADWTHTGNAEHFETSEFTALLLYVANISDMAVFLICGGYWK